MEPSMNSVDQNLSSSAASAVEVRRLLEENARLRSLLIAHSIPIPEAAQPTLHLPQTLNAALEVRKPGVATAEQRIALFRSLFSGREDVYAIRWENADGRSGYMPKADRYWKSDALRMWLAQPFKRLATSSPPQKIYLSSPLDNNDRRERMHNLLVLHGLLPKRHCKLGRHAPRSKTSEHGQHICLPELLLQEYALSNPLVALSDS